MNKKFTVLHTHGLGDFIYYIKGLQTQSKFPIKFIITQKSVAEFARYYFPNSEIKYVNGSFFSLFLELILNPGIFISHRLKSRYLRAINLFRGFFFLKSRKLFNVRKGLRSLEETIPRGHLARLGALHSLSLNENFSYQSQHINCLKYKNTEGILIHPGCGKNQSFKRWPTNNYFSLINKLIIHGIPVYITFGPDEQNLVSIYRGKFLSEKGVEIVANPTISKMVTLVGRVKLVLGSDNGISHLASLQDAPTISLFGPSNENKTRPINKNLIIVTSESRPNCSPCISRDNAKGCDSPICMSDISIDKVFNKILEVMSRREN